MENLTHALYMAFAVFVFIIAFTLTLYMVNKLNSTAKTLVYRLDKTNYYDSLVLNEIIKSNDDNGVDNRTAKIVGIDTIIPTLYRYYKESFAVKILDSDGSLLQYFDTTTESAINTAKSTLEANRTDEQKSLLELYDKGDANLFGAPWLGHTEDAQKRIDMYINGSKGYINNTLVDYSGENNLKKYRENNFKEIFSQYAYEGDTVTESTYDENGEVKDELISLTGTKQISTKIVITYQLLKDN